MNLGIYVREVDELLDNQARFIQGIAGERGAVKAEACWLQARLLQEGEDDVWWPYEDLPSSCEDIEARLTSEPSRLSPSAQLERR